MTRALITYCSKTGITKGFAYQLELVCREAGIETTVVPIERTTATMVTEADYVFLGCWTHGLFVVFQHPEQAWVRFAESLPSLAGKTVILFTTYKLAVGGMFGKMRRALDGQPVEAALEMKSRTSMLTTTDRLALQQLLVRSA